MEEKYIKLDYSLQNPVDRVNLVNKIIEVTPKEKMTENYKEILADYIIFAMDKDEKKKKEILTDNRMITINKRETSYQGLTEKFENGEDGVFNLITEDKNMLLDNKIAISEEDIQKIPPLKQLREAIETIKKQEEKASGKKKYLLKKQIIEMSQEQYLLRDDYTRGPVSASNVKSLTRTLIPEKIQFDEKNEPYCEDGQFSFFDYKHISALLCNYEALKIESHGHYEGDIWYILQDLDDLINQTLKNDYPMFYDLLFYKIDGLSNAEIQEKIEKNYGILHTPEYLSALWRKKIPKLLAEQAKKNYLEWYYMNKEYGKWKRCSRCGEIKLAHNLFFSKNNTSKDGWYSICKDCRNSKSKAKEQQKAKERMKKNDNNNSR